MKNGLLRLSWLALVLIVAPLFLFAQPTNKKWPNPHNDCSGNCFSAQVISASGGANGCTDYEMRISHDGSCRYGLSHLVVELPCGYVRNVEAKGGCSYNFGKDPTTGLTGLKIEGPQNFGKGFPNSFTFKFTWCNSASCLPGDCWEPRVAFKAATCVDYDTASNSCNAPSLKATVQKRNTNCSGNADGRLTVSAEGGQGPYTYSWSTGCDESTIDKLPEGNYTVTVTDTQGNEVTLTEVVEAMSHMTFSALTANPTCSGAANGTIQLLVSGGVEPYTYQWNTGATTKNITNLTGGSYRVTVTDSLGCAKDTVIQLVNPFISISGQPTRPGCGQSTGQIDVSVSGGAPPYTYAWSNGATTEDITGLSTGLYSITVSDANACASQMSFFLTENNTLHITFKVTPTTCVDNSSGAIDLTVTGGAPPYSYVWANGSTSEDLTGLSAGLQRVTVTDAGGCAASTIINVFTESFPVSSQVVAPSCSGQSDGSISVTPSGTPPFTYLWSTGETTSSISNLSSGVYFVTVTDNTGCSQQLSFFIQDPVINAFATVTNPSCGEEGNFAINLTLSGGVAPYAYGWSNGETTEDISGLNSGNYSVTITDANGCGKTLDVAVQPVVQDWSCSIVPPAVNPTCGSSGNTLSTSVTGASNYNWTVQGDGWTILTGQNSSSITYTAGSNGSVGMFALSITKGGCIQTCSYTVSGCFPVITCGIDSTATTLSSAPPATSTNQTLPAESSESPTTNTGKEFRLAVYPNPVIDKLSFQWTAEATEYVQIDLIDQFGKRIAGVYAGDVSAGEVYHLDWHAGNLSERICFYRYISGSRTLYGKILKGN